MPKMYLFIDTADAPREGIEKEKRQIGLTQGNESTVRLAALPLDQDRSPAMYEYGEIDSKEYTMVDG